MLEESEGFVLVCAIALREAAGDQYADWKFHDYDGYPLK